MTFAPGDLVLLVDGRGRRYLVTLAPGGSFHSHHGPVLHDAIIGSEEGSLVETSMGRRMRAFRPSLADFVLKMPRGAQVVYPKDLGPILIEADIFPGARVLEAGTGSGSLTLALLRAVGPKGTVHSFDVREDFHRKAVANIERFVSSDPNYGTLDARMGDMYADEIRVDVDRVVLDITEPWRALPNVKRCLRSGGLFCAYLPTVPQVQNLVEALRGGWGMVRTFETIQRGWTVDGLSVRPDHRMVAHTAFLVVARKLAPDAGRNDA
ncbi:MAG: tRNA (adenine-N1)-methyltransferase [Actinomycetota bacterium]